MNLILTSWFSTYFKWTLVNEYVEKNSVDLKTSVSIVFSLCEIMEQAHNIGLYHRDLKPDNIIIEEQSNLPIIIDFGICWLSDDTSFKTKKRS